MDDSLLSFGKLVLGTDTHDKHKCSNFLLLWNSHNFGIMAAFIFYQIVESLFCYQYQ